MFVLSGGIAPPRPSCADRKIPVASKGHCTAHAVFGDDQGTIVQAESWLELCLLTLLNADLDVALLEEQQRFVYGMGTRPSEHVFDVVATLQDGCRIAYTVKPEIRLNKASRSGAAFLEKMGVIAWHVKQSGFADSVQLLTETDIDQIDLRNATMFAAVRNADPEADQVASRAVDALPDGGHRTLRDLTLDTGMAARGYRALIRQMRNGFARQVGRGVIGPKSYVTRNYRLSAAAFERT